MKIFSITIFQLNPKLELTTKVDLFIDAIRFNEPCKFTRQSQLQTSLREANYLICFVEMKVGSIIGKKQEVGP